MITNRLSKSLQKWRNEDYVEDDLTSYQLHLDEIERLRKTFSAKTDPELTQYALTLKSRANEGQPLSDLLSETYALVSQAAERVLKMRPFDTQIVAAIALHQGKLVEMQTGEGKTLAAVLPACLNAFASRGVHVLTFNDYLARRDAAWMTPVYNLLGLSVGAIQEGMSIEQRREAYNANVTYATCKEAGFDFLRMQLCRNPQDIVQRPFSYAIIDEADSILIDEARIPLVIAGNRSSSDGSLYQIAQIIAKLEEHKDFDIDDNHRNVSLTEIGLDRVEADLMGINLYETQNASQLREVNQALHARVLLHRDIDYIVRDGRIELVDDFTGRVVNDRRWPDGIQAALEAKEKVSIQPGGRILGSITLQNFFRHYPRIAGMTGTAKSSAEELFEVYGLKVIMIPPHKPSIRNDLPDLVFTHKEAKYQAIISKIQSVYKTGQPILVGTSSVAESDLLASRLRESGVKCQVLNAKNDEAEAEIISRAGALNAVTISTNMAGRGTDIRLGDASEEERERVVKLGGLFIIGINRHESRRIDDQLRGRAGRQGDPGSSQFFVSLEDDLMQRFGIKNLIPNKFQSSLQKEPLDHPVILREVDRLQRIVEGQNYEIRKTLQKYLDIVEKQRISLQEWRTDVLTGKAELDVYEAHMPERYNELLNRFGKEALRQLESAITLHHIDQSWSDHLVLISEVRDSIHLLLMAGLNPLHEFHKQIAEAFLRLHENIIERIVETFSQVEVTEDGIQLDESIKQGPSSTWTYLINDQAGLTKTQQQMFSGPGNLYVAIAMMASLPALIIWKIRQQLAKRNR